MAELPLKEGEDRPSISPSMVKLFLGCAEAGRLRYIEGVRRPRGPSRAYGIACHEAAEENSRFKFEKGDELPRDEIMDRYHVAFEREIQLCLFPDDWNPNQQGILKDTGYEAVDLFHQKLAPRINPVGFEESFRAELDGPFDLMGYIDLIDNDTGEDAIRDFKFPTSPKSRQRKATEWIEGVFYALGYAQTHEGQLPAELSIDTVSPFTKQVYRSRVTWSVDDARRAISVAERVAEMIDKDVFPPNGLGTWRCNERYCDYYPCQYVIGQKGAADKP